MKIEIIIGVFFLSAFRVLSQGFAKDWTIMEKKINDASKVSFSEVSGFASRYEKEFALHPDRAMLIHSMLGYKYWEKKDSEAALQSFVRSYQFALKASDTTLKYTAIYRLGDFYKGHGNLVEAEKYYYYCMAPLSHILGQSSREYTQIFFEFTELLIGLGKYEYAKPNVDGLLFYYKTLDGENNLNYLSLLNYKAIIAQNQGDYNGAIELFSLLAAENRFLQLGDSSMHVTVLSNLANACRESGKISDALQYLKKAKQEYHRLQQKDISLLATIENNLGLCHKTSGNTAAAEEAFNTSILYHQQMGDRDLEGYCSVLSNKGDLLRELGRLGEASEFLLTAIETRRKYFGTNSVRYANAISNLAIVYYDAGYFQQALERNIEAEEIYRQVVGEDHQVYANCMNNLSLCYLHFKDYKKAEACKLKALQTISATVGKDHYRYISYLISTTSLYLKTNESGKAERNLREAILLAEKNFGKKHELYAHARLLLAEIYSMRRQFAQAADLYAESVDYYRGLLNAYFNSMSENEQSHYLALISPLFESYNLFVINYRLQEPKRDLSAHLRRSLQNQLLLKSMLTSRSASLKREVYNSGSQELIALYLKWTEAQNELVNRFKSTGEGADNNELMFQINKLETELKKRLPGYVTEHVQPETIRNALAANEAAVEIFKTEEVVNDTQTVIRYGAYVLRKDLAEPLLVIFKQGHLLDGAYFSNFSRSVDNQWTDSLSYSAYFQDLLPALKGIGKLYVSPEGIFRKINLSGLYNPRSKQYVHDQMDICYTSNLASVVKRNKAGAHTSAVLFGYPDYEFDFEKKISLPSKEAAQSVAKRFGLANLPALPGTRKEVEEIEKQLKAKSWQVTVYTEAQASEQNLRGVNAPAILHIATHGYYLKDVESADKSFMGFETASFKNLSLLRSGIILAGAGPATTDSVHRKSENDGIVTALEACQLNLTNTELLVLSACQTGLGDDYGTEGVGGLQRSFAIAGARNIIMSLWPVDDEATQQLMSSFYSHYAENGNAEESLKKARTEVKSRYRHPYYWAAFILLKTQN